jgi:hypothetical protein
MATDTFPALQQDALTLIKSANALILLARQLRADAMRGDAESVRATCAEIGIKGEALGSFCGAFGATARHFVTYTD